MKLARKMSAGKILGKEKVEWYSCNKTPLDLSHVIRQEYPTTPLITEC
jgi:hypothetical protein